MRMIAGLEEVSDGEILIEKVNDLEPKDRDVAMVFDYALYPNMNVYENIRFPLKVRELRKTNMMKKYVQLLKWLSYLNSFIGSRLNYLVAKAKSGFGQGNLRQPNVFLMDEPLSNLDAKLRLSTRAQIKNLSHELAVTTIYVTHDQVEAMTLADRVVVMNQGVVQQVGSPTDIYERPANTFVAGFIGSPAMNLVDGKLLNNFFTADGVKIDNLNGPNGHVVLGFRAEDAKVVKDRGQIEAPIYALELLGEATMVTVRIGTTFVAVKTDKKYRSKIGDTVSIEVPREICHLFSGETGKRID